MWERAVSIPQAQPQRWNSTLRWWDTYAASVCKELRNLPCSRFSLKTSELQCKHNTWLHLENSSHKVRSQQGLHSVLCMYTDTKKSNEKSKWIADERLNWKSDPGIHLHWCQMGRKTDVTRSRTNQPNSPCNNNFNLFDASHLIRNISLASVH